MASELPVTAPSVRDRLTSVVGPFVRHPVAVTLIVVVGVLAAVLSSLGSDPRYESEARFALRTTPPNTQAQRILDERVTRIDRRLGPLHAIHVDVLTKLDDPVVRVIATQDSRRGAIVAANAYTSELLAAELGVDRQALERQIARTRGDIDRLKGGSSSPRAIQLRRRVARLKSRRISDSQFRAATSTDQVAGSDPLKHAALSLPVALLIAAAVALALDRIQTREASEA